MWVSIAKLAPSFSSLTNLSLNSKNLQQKIIKNLMKGSKAFEMQKVEYLNLATRFAWVSL